MALAISERQTIVDKSLSVNNDDTRAPRYPARQAVSTVKASHLRGIVHYVKARSCIHPTSLTCTVGPGMLLGHLQPRASLQEMDCNIGIPLCLDFMSFVEL